MTPPSLSVATYNIHSARGTDGIIDPSRIARVVAALGVDVAALQEVPLRPSGRGRQPHAAWLERETGMQAISGPTLARGESGFGNVVLTRVAVTRVRMHDLSVPGAEPRGAIEAVVRDRAGEEMRIVATHLGLGAAERVRQARALVASVTEDEPPASAVLLGDLNAWLPGSRAMRILVSKFGGGPRLRTFPSRAPVLALDRILARAPARVVGARTVTRGEARRASDHVPAVARIEAGR